MLPIDGVGKSRDLIDPSERIEGEKVKSRSVEPTEATPKVKRFRTTRHLLRKGTRFLERKLFAFLVARKGKKMKFDEGPGQFPSDEEPPEKGKELDLSG